MARLLAASAPVWRRILTDPVDGHVVTQQIRSYRPSPAMRRFVLTRANHTCAARGCGHRARLQLDHVVAHPRGPTTADNLTPLDPGHHDNKTKGGWAHRLDPHTGALTQTSPLGRTYTTMPLPPRGPRPRPNSPAHPSARPARQCCAPAAEPPTAPTASPRTSAAPAAPTAPPTYTPAIGHPAGPTTTKPPTNASPPNFIAETDYDLIDRLNAEYLDLLNDPTDDDADDP